MANALTIAPRINKPALFSGTDAQWRVLCDLYPTAELPEIILAVVEYCVTRRLDPFRKPVHVVPIYNSKLRRRVQVVMQGINEIETTAARTQRWTGMDLPQWGREIERTFRGVIENDDGSKFTQEVTVQFPEWCAVTCYRLVAGENRAFTEQLWWLECYGTAGFRSEIPNERWRKAPRQMLHKCTKAATLRAAFPEEGLGYTQEEMEDREVDAGGVTLEGVVDYGDPGLTDKDRLSETPIKTPETVNLDMLNEPNGTQWLKNLKTILAGVTRVNDVTILRGDPRIIAKMADDKVPKSIKGIITDLFREAFERFPPTNSYPTNGKPPTNGKSTSPAKPADQPDTVADLIAEIEMMDQVTLDGLSASGVWRARVRDATAEFPPDREQIDDAIKARIYALRGGSK